MKQRIERFYPLIIFLFAILLYANTIPNDYNLDDELVTVNHRTTSKGFAGIKEIFTSFYYEDDMGYKYDYRPVTHLSFAIEHQFLGENPHTSHAINVIFYGLLCLLIFYLVNRLAPDKGPLLGFIVALIFCVHPIHTEVVASIKNRDEILSMLFGLGAFYIVVSTTKQRHLGSGLLWLVFAFFLFSLSVYAKLSAVGLVILIPIYLLLNRSFKWEHFIFSIPSTLLIANMVFGWGPTTLLLLILVNLFLLVWFLLSEEQSRAKIIGFTRLSMFQNQWVYLFLIYIFLALAYLNGSSLMLTASLSLVLGYLVIVYLKKGPILLNMLLAFPIILLVTHSYAVYNFAVGYLIIFALFSRETDLKKLMKYLLALLLMSSYVIFTGGFILGIVIVVLFLFSIKNISKYVITLLVFAYLVFDKESALDLILAFGFAFCILLLVWSSFLKISIKQQVGILGGVIFLGISSFYLHLELNKYDGLPEERIHEVVNVSELATIVKPESQDRDILFVENPIIDNWNLESRVALALNVNSFYLAKLVWPYPLSYYYGFDQIKFHDFKDWQTIASIFLLFALIALAFFFLIKGNHLVFYALLWLELSLLPYTNLFTPVAGIVGERLTFTASFGFCVLLGLVVLKALGSFKFKKLAYAFSFALIFLASFFVLKRNALWKNELTLFGNDMHHLNKSAQANALLAYEFMRLSTKITNEDQIRGYRIKASEYLENAVQIYPDFFNWHFDLGRIYFDNKELIKSKNSFQQAIELDSTYRQSYYYLLDITKLNSNWKEATIYGSKILASGEQDLYVLMSLSETFYYAEDYLEVLKINDQIIQLDASIPEAYLNKAYAYLKLGEIDEMKEMLVFAERLNPEHGDLLYLRTLLP